MTTSFAQLHERWINQQDPDLARQMIESYRGAWDSGLLGERRSVLSFIARSHRTADALDIFIQSVESDDPYLARHAMSVTMLLIRDGLDVGARMRDALQNFGQRFPQWAEMSETVLRYLDEKSAES